MGKLTDFLDEITRQDAIADARMVRLYSESDKYGPWDWKVTLTNLLLTYGVAEHTATPYLHRDGEALNGTIYISDESSYEPKESLAQGVAAWLLHGPVEKDNIVLHDLSQPSKQYIFDFALELLLPANQVTQLLKSQSFYQVASTFEVSTRALALQLRNLNLV